MKPDHFIPAQGEPRGLVHQVEPRDPTPPRHFYGLLTRHLNEHLPVNPVRVVFKSRKLDNSE